MIVRLLNATARRRLPCLLLVSPGMLALLRIRDDDSLALASCHRSAELPPYTAKASVYAGGARVFGIATTAATEAEEAGRLDDEAMSPQRPAAMRAAGTAAAQVCVHACVDKGAAPTSLPHGTDGCCAITSCDRELRKGLSTAAAGKGWQLLKGSRFCILADPSKMNVFILQIDWLFSFLLFTMPFSFCMFYAAGHPAGCAP